MAFEEIAGIAEAEANAKRIAAEAEAEAKRMLAEAENAGRADVEEAVKKAEAEIVQMKKAAKRPCSEPRPKAAARRRLSLSRKGL